MISPTHTKALVFSERPSRGSPTSVGPATITHARTAVFQHESIQCTSRADTAEMRCNLWLVMCADTKLVPVWRVGSRKTKVARSLMHDLEPRLRYRVQMTTDGHSPYLEAVEEVFGGGIDYARIVKNYSEKGKDDQPDGTDFISKYRVEGDPDEAHVSTSYVERQNLTMRMAMRRFIRRTNGFSKTRRNHKRMVALYFMHYNFCRIHETIGVTPAMEAGVTTTLWDESDIVDLIDEATPEHSDRVGRTTRRGSGRRSPVRTTCRTCGSCFSCWSTRRTTWWCDRLEPPTTRVIGVGRENALPTPWLHQQANQSPRSVQVSRTELRQTEPPPPPQMG